MKKNDMPKGFFTTADLGLVAFLTLQKYTLSKIDSNDGGRAFFTLRDDSKREALVLQFFNKQTTVEPLTFLDQIRNLKSLIRQKSGFGKLAKGACGGSGG